MNSMEELNGYGTTRREFTDDRPYSIAFTPNSPTNPSITVNQDVPFTHQLGTNITSMISQAGNVIYTVDVGNVSGATVTWPALPPGVTSTDLGNGVYRLNNVNTVGRWNQVKAPTITLPIAYGTNFTYTSSIDDQQGNSRSWTVNVTINAYYGLVTSRNYYEDTGSASPGASGIAVVDIGPDPILIVAAPSGPYTITFEQISPDPATNIGRFYYSGGAVSEGSITVTDTKSWINGVEWFYQPPADYTGNITLTYTQVYDSTTQVNAVQIQLTNIGTNNEYTVPGNLKIGPVSNSNWNLSTTLALDDYSITDPQPLYAPVRTYDIEIATVNTNNDPINIGNFYVGATAYTGGSIALSGTEAVINNSFANLTFTNTSDSWDSAKFLYNQTQTRDNIVQATNIVTNLNREPELGTFMEGGYLAGKIDYNQNGVGNYYLIISPRASGERLDDIQYKTTASSDGALGISLVDGYQNTQDLNDVNHPLFQWVTALSINGKTDWYIPAFAELQQIYVNLKPGSLNNNTGYGINSYGVPIRSAVYTTSNPAQTSLTDWRDVSGQTRGSEAFVGYINNDEHNYWSSTSLNGLTQAKFVQFHDGRETDSGKANTLSARAIRRVAI